MEQIIIDSSDRTFLTLWSFKRFITLFMTVALVVAVEAIPTGKMIRSIGFRSALVFILFLSFSEAFTGPL